MIDLNEVLLLTSNKLGDGDNKLGEILIKSFIHVLTESDKLSGTIILYNSGVLLATKESASIEDLKTLENKGIKILICGTCIDFYEISDKIAVGNISNMKTIVQELENAKKVIKP